MSVRTVFLSALLACPGAFAAEKKGQLPPLYDQWLNREAVYIITADERREFLKLPSDPARDKFIDDFWEIRNPLRGSKENPYREEHYRRIEYANQNFGRMSNTPGWMTDMGRTWILFGKPASRAPFKGYSQLYPVELWFYPNNTGSPSMPPFFYVMFYMPEDIGEYRFYRPFMDGPMKLVRGTQFQSNRDVYNFLKPIAGDLARAAFSLNPSEPIDTVDFTTSMGGDMQVAKIENFADDKWYVERLREARYLKAKVTSWFLVQQDKPLELTTLPLADPAGQYWLDYAVLIDDEKLGAPDSTGTQLALSIAYRLMNDKGDLIVEDAEDRAYPAYEEKRFRPFLAANRIPLVPGKYRLEVTVVNRTSGHSYRGEQAVEAGGGPKVTIAGPLMAASVQQVRAPEPMVPFQYFGAQFRPAGARTFGVRQPIRVLYQLHGAPAGYQVDYVLGQVANRAVRQTVTDEIQAAEFRDGRLLRSKSLPLSGLEPGEYRIALNVRAAGSQEVLASVSLPFRIASDAVETPLYFASSARNMAAPGVASYVRSLEWLAQKDEARAAESLRQSLDQMPKNLLAAQALVQIYFGARKYGEITSLYQRLGAPAFQSAPETVAQAAVSFWQTGNVEGAKRVLEAGETFFPRHPLLAAAAKQISAPRSK